MSIELHCPKCAKLIRAPDNAGGKRGKCPYCKESIYIPLLPDDGEEIGIAPIDDADKRREKELRRESIGYVAAVGHVKDAPPEGAAARGSRSDAAPSAAPGEVVDMGQEVEAFLSAMRDSKLTEADQAVARLKQTGARAKDHVEGLLLDEMPPSVKGLAPPLVKGLLKTLSERLS